MASDFERFYSDLKKTESDDSKLTSDQQISRLLRPGSTYLNLNPFEVLQLEPECDVEQARKKYKRLSILVHPDKNPDDRDRADKAFDILKKALATLEDPDELARCREVYVEARARLAIIMTLWGTVTKVFADREKKRRTLEDRANEEKRRLAEEVQKAAEKRKLEEEYKANYEQTRDVRRGSWRDFVKKKEKKLANYSGANFRPIQQHLETSAEATKKPKIS
ncbi:J domain-containing protein [Aphelenchoides besseyi]|nr:J domain-containing protein [Aphelenchoides besseyi]